MNGLSWTCHACGEERPDALISVFTRDLSPGYNLPSGTMKQNLRYCNDRPKCLEDVRKTPIPTGKEDPP